MKYRYLIIMDPSTITGKAGEALQFQGTNNKEHAIEMARCSQVTVFDVEHGAHLVDFGNGLQITPVTEKWTSERS